MTAVANMMEAGLDFSSGAIYMPLPHPSAHEYDVARLIRNEFGLMPAYLVDTILDRASSVPGPDWDHPDFAETARMHVGAGYFVADTIIDRDPWSPIVDDEMKHTLAARFHSQDFRSDIESGYPANVSSDQLFEEIGAPADQFARTYRVWTLKFLGLGARSRWTEDFGDAVFSAEPLPMPDHRDLDLDLISAKRMINALTAQLVELGTLPEGEAAKTMRLALLDDFRKAKRVVVADAQRTPGHERRNR